LTRKAYFSAVAALLLLAWIGTYAYFSNRAATVFLTLEIASSTPSASQLFFDTGSGFREADSHTVYNGSSSLTEFKHLFFELPGHSNLVGLRFDPLTAAGTFIVRNVSVKSGDGVLLRIPPEDIVAFNQIAERVQRGNEVLFSTIPVANDPGVTLRLRQPLKQSRRFQRVLHNPSFWIAFVAVFFTALLLALQRNPLLSAAGWAALHLRRADSLLARVAARLSTPEVLPLDSSAIWFCAACCTLFLIATGLNLNGSSAGVYPAVYQHGAPARILLGSPRQIRADEWAYVTPDILNQALRADRFQTLDSELGPHSVALTGNIPIRHISTLFRAQYWAFFVLPPDYAFAFYWQCKALVLVLGTFAWLLVLTHSTFWSVTGSLWYFFSPLTQWGYSWPSALPEMIGFILLATAMACCLTVEKRKPALLIQGVGLTVCAIVFALCAYLPHMIPLFWLAAFFFGAWCIAKRRAIFQRDQAAARLFAFACAAATITAIGLLIFADLRVALAGIADTVFPGHRSLSGGTTRWSVLLSGFMAWTLKESRIPAALGNICEGSSFLWLAPLTLILFGRLKLTSFQKLALVSLWLSFSIILLWLIFPIPAEVGRLLGFDRTFGQRLVPALGLANVAITILCAQALPEVSERTRAAGTILGFAVLLFALRAANRDLDRFFNRQEVLLAALMVAGLIYLLLARRKWAFAALLILPQAFVFGRVNPIERGLSVYLDSDLCKFIRQNPVLLNGKWLIFSDSVVSSGFLAATGADVYTGTRYLPNIDHFPVFASNRLDLNTLNRDGYLDAHLRRAEEPMKLEMPSPIVVQWDVRPGDPILKQIGIKYAAFDLLPDEQTLTFMQPLSQKPVDGFWLYRLR